MLGYNELFNTESVMETWQNTKIVFNTGDD